jgi:NitT/TauT family transport system substrate-binding protein
VLALPALLLATSCSLIGGSKSSQSGAAPVAVEHPNINVGYMQVADCAPFQIAYQRGYFKDEGLNVTASPVVSGSQSVPAVHEGRLDFAFSNWSTLLISEAEHADDYKIVADGSQGSAGDMAVTTWPGSGINNVRDLVGKRVSTNADNDVPFLALKAIFQANGLDINTLNIVIVHHPQTPQALAAHQVDAAIQLEPYLTQAAKTTGARPVVDLFGPGPTANLPLAGYFTTAQFATANPKTVAAFSRAIQRAAAEADRRTVEQVIPTYTAIDRDTAALVTLPDYPSSLDATRLQRVADLMKNYGLLHNHLDLSSMIISTPPSP